MKLKQRYYDLPGRVKGKTQWWGIGGEWRKANPPYDDIVHPECPPEKWEEEEITLRYPGMFEEDVQELIQEVKKRKTRKTKSSAKAGEDKTES